MKQEEKELLLKDLCARLPYGVKVYRKWVAPLSGSPEETVADFSIFDIEVLSSPYNWCSTEKGPREVRGYKVKPYLFPLSSMTEEQKEELKELCNMYDPYHDYDSYENWGVEVFEKHIHSDNYKFTFTADVVDWLNKTISIIEVLFLWD